VELPPPTPRGRPWQRRLPESLPPTQDLGQVARGLPAAAWRQITWRHGSKGPMSSRLAQVPVWAAHRLVGPEQRRAAEWLLIEWPGGADAPTDYWLCQLAGASVGLRRLMPTFRHRLEADVPSPRLCKRLAPGERTLPGKSLNKSAPSCVMYGHSVTGILPAALYQPHKPTHQNHMKKLLATVCALALTSLAALAGEYPDISIAELKKAIADKKVTVIDVNGADSYKKGHVPTAVDYTAVKGDLAAALPKDKDALIVAYCGSPSCSAYTSAANAAKKLGYTNVKHLSAGISGWKDAKEDLAK